MKGDARGTFIIVEKGWGKAVVGKELEVAGLVKGGRRRRGQRTQSEGLGHMRWNRAMQSAHGEEFPMEYGASLGAGGNPTRFVRLKLLF